MSSLSDTLQMMQMRQLESMQVEQEHKVRKARAEADLAELILKRVREAGGDVLAFPKVGAS